MQHGSEQQPFPVVLLLQGSTKTYSPHDMCASPARDYKYAPLILHDVVLTDLVRVWICTFDLLTAARILVSCAVSSLMCQNLYRVPSVLCQLQSHSTPISRR